MSQPQAQSHRFTTATTVDAEDVARFSRIASEWWDEHGKFAPLHRLNPTRLAYLREQICAHTGNSETGMTPFSGLTLLDIGCGGGLISEPMTRLGAQVTSIDASEENIAVAKLHAEKQGLSIDYRAMPPEELLAENRQFDVVLALEIIEHVADLDAFYDTLRTLVKPGGLLIMSTLNRTAASFAMAIVGAEYVMRWLPKGTHQWSQFLRPSELAAGLTPRGFTITDTCGISYNPLSRDFSLNPRDLRVNYLLTATRDAR